MEFGTVEGEQRYAALVRAAAGAVIGLDFDGTLAPIVDDPASAHIHDEAADVLVVRTGNLPTDNRRQSQRWRRWWMALQRAPRCPGSQPSAAA